MLPSRRELLLLAGVAVTALVIPYALFIVAVAGTPTPWHPDFDYPETPTQFYTAREAYDIALPHLGSWHEDAVVTGIHHGPSGSPEVWGLRPDGRGPAWSFEVASRSAMQYTTITVMDGVAFVSGRDGQPELPIRSDPTPLPSGWGIDSYQALSIAGRAGAVGLPTMISTTHWLYNPQTYPTPQPVQLAWQLSYGERGSDPTILIDAYSGAVLQNDFAH